MAADIARDAGSAHDAVSRAGAGIGDIGNHSWIDKRGVRAGFAIQVVGDAGGFLALRHVALEKFCPQLARAVVTRPPAAIRCVDDSVLGVGAVLIGAP